MTVPKITRSRSFGRVGQKVWRRQEPLSVETAMPEAPVLLVFTYEAPRFDMEDVEAQLLSPTGGADAGPDLDERTPGADVNELGRRANAGQVQAQLSGHDGHHADAITERQSVPRVLGHPPWDGPVHTGFTSVHPESPWHSLRVDTSTTGSPPVVEKFSLNAVLARPSRKMPSMTKIERYWGLDHGYCARCDQPARCEKAHIIDRCYGGLDGVQNLVPLCYPCHANQFSFSPGEEPLALVLVFNLYHDFETDGWDERATEAATRALIMFHYLRMADSAEEAGRLITAAHNVREIDGPDAAIGAL